MDVLPDDLIPLLAGKAWAWLPLRATCRDLRRAVDTWLENTSDSDAYANAVYMRVRSARYMLRLRMRNVVEPPPRERSSDVGRNVHFQPPEGSGWHEAGEFALTCMAFTVQGHRCSSRVHRPPYLCIRHRLKVPFLHATLRAHVPTPVTT